MAGQSKAITVRHVWDLALGPTARLAAGERGLGRSVEWVTTLHAAYPLFPDLDQGHLAIARPEVARRIDAGLTPSYLIRELARADAAGLVIDEAPDAPAVALADDLALPLFIVSSGTDLRDLEREILRTLVDYEGQEARHAARWRQGYLEALAERGTAAVIERLATEFGVQVRLRDEAGMMLSRVGGNGSGPLAEIEETYPVAVAGRTLGTLWVGATGQPSPYWRLAAREAAEVCALEMIQTCVRRETQDQLGADLVTDLLSPQSDQANVQARLARQGYDLTPGRRHAVIAITAPESQASQREATAASLGSDLRFNGRREAVCALTCSYNDISLCLVSCVASTSEQRFRTLLGQVAQPHATHGFHFAVSRLLPDFAGLSQAMQQALATDKMRRRLRDHRGPLYYSDLGLYRLLLGLRDQTEVLRFHGDTLGRLVDYDREHNTDLVRTLQVYFEQNSNASETARKLYVHRNTLSYRLQRISEIVGLDLDSADARLALQVALRIHLLGT